MEEQDQFDSFVRAGLAQLGTEVDDADLAVMRVVEQIYGPPRKVMLAADMSALRPEVDLDPSSAPHESGSGAA